MNKLIFSILFLISTHKAFSQYKNLSCNNFMKWEVLNQEISLDKDFDYELVHYAILHYTNKHRKNSRKSSLTYSNTLEKSALLHSTQMKKYDFFDHINRKERKYRDLDDRAKYVNYTNFKELAENLYYGFVDMNALPTYAALAQTIVQALIDSKTHNLNLINQDLKEMGAYIVFKNESENGFLYYYVTQSFGTKFP